MIRITVLLLTLLFATHSAADVDLVRSTDTKWRFSVDRPKSWSIQPNPNTAIRFMFGIEQEGYGGNCNVGVIPSSSTKKLNQNQVDSSENRRILTPVFFRTALKGIASDVEILSVKQLQRGNHWGQLVEYTYSYDEPSINIRVYMHNEMFSHSRPGSVFTFTCVLGTTSRLSSAAAFKKERAKFQRLTASLRVNP